MKKVLALLLVVGLVALGIASTYEAPLALVFGWISFLWRVLPQMTLNGPSVAVGCGAYLLFAAGVHWAGTSWIRRKQTEQLESARHWKVRWTLAIVVGLTVLFASGISLVGIAHQGIWLFTSDRPLTEEVEQLRSGNGLSYNNLQELGNGALNHAQSNRMGFTQYGGPFHGWEIYCLQGRGYYAKIDMKEPWNSPQNQKYYKCVVPSLINPQLRVSSLTDEEGYGLCHYAANVHIFGGNKNVDLENLPNRAQTILIGEINAEFKPWGAPGNWRDPTKGINRSPHGFGGPPGSGGALFVMGDGTVRFVSEKVSPGVLRTLSGLPGGEEIDIDEVAPRR